MPTLLGQALQQRRFSSEHSSPGQPLCAFEAPDQDRSIAGIQHRLMSRANTVLGDASLTELLTLVTPWEVSANGAALVLRDTTPVAYRRSCQCRPMPPVGWVSMR